MGLRIKTIDADGNCFFRSVLDQLEVGWREGEREKRRVGAAGAPRQRAALPRVLYPQHSSITTPAPTAAAPHGWLAGWLGWAGFLGCRVREATTWGCAAG